MEIFEELITQHIQRGQNNVTQLKITENKLITD